MDPLIWAENGELGFAMNAALTQAGLPGVLHNSMYNGWWQGAFMMQAWWHNMVGLLTETASADIATTITQETAKPGVINGGALMTNEKYLDALEENPDTPLPAPRDVMPRNNYPNPWLGGTWSLRQVVDYQLTSAYGLLEAIADRKASLIRNQAALGLRAIAQGNSESPRAFIIPAVQHDTSAVARLIDILDRMGVEVGRASEDFESGDRRFSEGDFIVSLAQPYRAFVKDLLEKQTYPDSSLMPSGSMTDTPYDVTAWTLPMQFGVEAVAIENNFAVPASKLEGVPAPVGSFSGGDIAEPAGFLIYPESTNRVTATNRLLKQGAEIYWIAEESAGRAAGAIFAKGVQRSRDRAAH